MGPFRALLVVDAEKFSGHFDRDLPELHLKIRDALKEACARSGLGEAWAKVRFMESTGDGVLAALDPEAIPALIDPFVRHLQEILDEEAPELRARELRLRLRVALHFGLVDDERPKAPGISTAVVDVSRLLDSAPLRDALEKSDPGVTFAALLISEEVFRTYVAGGWVKGLKKSQFTRVDAKVKNYERPAYLYVPVPSSIEVKEEPAEPQPASPSVSGITITGDGTQNAIGNTIGRDLRQERR